MNVVFMIILMFPVAQTGCKSEWIEYSAEKSCLRFPVDQSSWTKAKATCIGYGSTLVQPWNKAKLTFIKDNNKNVEQEEMHWIGVHDTDADGSYQYMNDTKSVISEGKMWEAVHKGPCVAASLKSGDWTGEACSTTHYFTCEYYQNPFTEPQDPLACSKKRCTDCRKEDWFHLREQKTYIYINKAPAKYADGYKNCKMLGGNLLQDAKGDKFQYIKDKIKYNWSPRGVFYWVGVLKPDKNWKWIGEERLVVNDKLQWYIEPLAQKLCAAVVWDQSFKLRATRCGNLEYQTCEASAPCQSLPRMKLNRGLVFEDGRVELAQEVNVKFKCFLKGFSRNVSLLCSGEVESSPGKNVVLKMIYLDRKLHADNCVCRVTHSDGTVEQAILHVFFKTAPTLTKGYSNETHTTCFDEDNDFSHTFGICAYPEPKSYELNSTESEVNAKDFNVTWKPLATESFYDVTLFIPKPVRKSTYKLTIGNEYGDPLVYELRIKDCSVDPSSKEETDSFPLLIISILVVTTCALLALILKTQSEKIYAETDDEDGDEIEISDPVESLGSISNITSTKTSYAYTDDVGYRMSRRAMSNFRSTDSDVHSTDLDACITAEIQNTLLYDFYPSTRASSSRDSRDDNKVGSTFHHQRYDNDEHSV